MLCVLKSESTGNLSEGLVRIKHLGFSKAYQFKQYMLLDILLFPIFKVATFGLFQEKRINSHIDAKMVDSIVALVKSYNSYQRVQGFQTIEFVVLIYGVNSYDLIHRLNIYKKLF